MGFLAYLLKLNLVLIISWLIYRTVFRNLTFFKWNRIYLMASLVLSFLLPLLRLPRGSRLAIVADMNGINWEQMEFIVPGPAPGLSAGGGLHGFPLILLVYFSGLLILTVLFCIRFSRLGRQMRRSEKVHDGPISVFVQKEDRGSFTFFRRIYLDRHAWVSDSGHIFKHERVHASQLHSIDLLLITFLCVVLWFNPFVFLLLRAVRENHEFLADAPARDAGSLQLADYLACLRDETLRRYSPVAANHFKSSTIKKRIIMLTNNRSQKQKKLVYLLLIPLFSFLLAAFQAPVEETGTNPVKILIHNDKEAPSIFPLPEEFMARISWSYGKRIHPVTKEEVFHQGVDLNAPAGTSVFATSSGKVSEAGFSEARGNYLVLVHGKSFVTRYTHLKEHRVKEGQNVSRGQVIATVGSTGRSTGPHLHYEVWKDGDHVNPEDYY